VLTKNYYFTALLLLSLRILSAQQINPTIPQDWCGTHGYSPWLTWYHDHKAEISSLRNDDSTMLYVPVTMHLVGPDNATSFYEEKDCFRILCELNEQYAPARIYFYFSPGEPFVYHAKSSWYNHDWEGGQDMIESTRIPDRLNCYIVADPAGNCGYSWLDAIVMGTGCSNPGNSTWAHEAGHHFSLPHPFFGWEGHNWTFNQPAPLEWDGYPVEKMDGSNCYDSGDRFCDTRPDYLNYRWNCDAQQLSTVTQKDPDGVVFRSDASLYMSYSLDACTSRFTEEQIEAMRTNLFTEHISYLQTFDFGGLVADDAKVTYLSPIDSSIQQYNNIVLEWAPVDNATFYYVEVSTSPFFSIVFSSAFVYDNITSLKITKNIPNNKTMYWRVTPYSEWDVCKSIASLPPAIFKTKNLSATNELERVADISLTPNPVAGGNSVILGVNSSESIDMMLTINDASGRLCFQKFVEMYSGDNQMNVSTDRLEAGLYFVTIQTSKGTLVKRLVVTK
jgi:hypothetical protein